MNVVESTLDLIGNTPIVKLKSLTKSTADGNVFVKLENLNPSGSYKDRMALRIIEDAERAGLLKPGRTIIESSSGNTAIALAYVGGMKRYKVKVFISEASLTDEKKKILTRYGAQFVTTPSPVPLAQREEARKAGLPGEMLEEPGRALCMAAEEKDSSLWWARQFSNPSNFLAHADMGREILKQLNRKVDVFVSSIGTGGNFMGVSHILKESNPRTRCVAVEPTGWAGEEAVLSGWKSGVKQEIPGVTGGIQKQIVDEDIADEIVQVGNEEARETAYKLSREEGIFCGMSTGANVYVALKEAKKLPTGNVVTICVDRGDRYFSDERYTT
ncbi:MAG: cysteine synthase family protein [Candidatus Bathyarchaeia archaeon]|jgi:cysteine synthase A